MANAFSRKIWPHPPSALRNTWMAPERDGCSDFLMSYTFPREVGTGQVVEKNTKL